MSIHLIGTVHGDIQGKERLEKALEVEEPGIITVEFNQENLSYFKEYRKKVEAELLAFIKSKWELTPEVLEVREEIGKDETRLLYDVYVPQDFARRKEIPFHMIDKPRDLGSPAMSEGEAMEEVGSSITIITSLIDNSIKTRKQLIEATDSIYKEMQEAYDCCIPGRSIESFLNISRGFSIGKRDRYMAERLQELASTGKKIVHVGGAIHFLDDKKGDTLYSTLIAAGLHPTRATLASYNKLGEIK